MIVFDTSLIGKRENNEDQHHIILNSSNQDKNLNNIDLFAVYDGHGGNKVSKFLKDNLAAYFIKKDVKYPLDKKYIYKVFNHLQKKLEIEHKNFAYPAGSTCIVIINYIYNNNNYFSIMNAGDCRAVLCSSNMAIPLTKDHKPHWPEETKRIEQLGGHIYYDGVDYRINNLSVSRSFGDLDAVPYVTHVPDIFKHKVTSNDDFIVIACDGLWDVLSNEDVINFVLNNAQLVKKDKKDIMNRCDKYNVILKDKRINLAKSLAEYAISKGSMDNVSVIIVFL